MISGQQINFKQLQETNEDFTSSFLSLVFCCLAEVWNMLACQSRKPMTKWLTFVHTNVYPAKDKGKENHFFMLL